MIDGKKIIVVMPAYNAENTLEKTYGEIPFEIVDDVVLVDDKSSDNTSELGKKIGINTHLTNKIVHEALKKNLIKNFNQNIKINSEKVFGKKTRFDFFLENKNIKTFLEVKNVTLNRKDKIAEFPDSITSRGTKHLNELMIAAKKGFKAYLLFVIQREDCNKFEIAKDIDIEYSKSLINAIKHKVKVRYIINIPRPDILGEASGAVKHICHSHDSPFLRKADTREASSKAKHTVHIGHGPCSRECDSV